MKALRLTLIAVLVAGAIAGPLVIGHDANAQWRAKNEVLRQQFSLTTRLIAENQRLSNAVARAASTESLSPAQLVELMKLRNETGQLRDMLPEMDTLPREIARLRARWQDVARELERRRDSNTALLSDVMVTRRERVAQLKQWLEENPVQKIPEMRSLSDRQWIDRVEYPLVTDDDFLGAAASLRNEMEGAFANKAMRALQMYARANNGQFPGDLSELKPFFASPIDDDVLQRWEIVPAKTLCQFLAERGGDWLVTQKVAVNRQLDMRYVANATTSAGTSGAWDPVP